MYTKNINTTEISNKFNKLLGDTKLEDLPIDFLGTMVFSDLYSKEKLLGCGAFGVVLKVIERKTSDEFAMKIMSKENMVDSGNSSLEEAQMLAKINHPSIIKLIRVFLLLKVGSRIKTICFYCDGISRSWDLKISYRFSIWLKFSSFRRRLQLHHEPDTQWLSSYSSNGHCSS